MAPLGDKKMPYLPTKYRATLEPPGSHWHIRTESPQNEDLHRHIRAIYEIPAHHADINPYRTNANVSTDPFQIVKLTLLAVLVENRLFCLDTGTGKRFKLAYFLYRAR